MLFDFDIEKTNVLRFEDSDDEKFNASFQSKPKGFKTILIDDV